MKRYLSIIAIIVVLISSTFATTVYGAGLQDLSESGNTIYEIQVNSGNDTVESEQSSDGWLKSHKREFQEHINENFQWIGNIFRHAANILVSVAEAGIGAVTIAGNVAFVGVAVTAALSVIGTIIAGIVMFIKRPKSQKV